MTFTPKPKTPPTVHWLFPNPYRRGGATRTFCGKLITHMVVSEDTKKVNCLRCKVCMRLHGHLPEETT